MVFYHSPHELLLLPQLCWNGGCGIAYIFIEFTNISEVHHLYCVHTLECVDRKSQSEFTAFTNGCQWLYYENWIEERGHDGKRLWKQQAGEETSHSLCVSRNNFHSFQIYFFLNILPLFFSPVRELHLLLKVLKIQSNILFLSSLQKRGIFSRNHHQFRAQTTQYVSTWVWE